MYRVATPCGGVRIGYGIIFLHDRIDIQIFRTPLFMLSVKGALWLFGCCRLYVYIVEARCSIIWIFQSPARKKPRVGHENLNLSRRVYVSKIEEWCDRAKGICIIINIVHNFGMFIPKFTRFLARISLWLSHGHRSVSKFVGTADRGEAGYVTYCTFKTRRQVGTIAAI